MSVSTMTDESTEATTSWEAVLAAVEADVRRTESLLGARGEWSAPVAGAPAEAMLPTPARPHVEVSWAELPSFEQMPPVPPELADRIRALRADIVSLQAEITAEMAAWRESCAHRQREAARPTATSGAAFYVDRRL
jgi:hypothetical protein